MGILGRSVAFPAQLLTTAVSAPQTVGAATFAGQGTFGANSQYEAAAALTGVGSFGATSDIEEAAGLSGSGTFGASYTAGAAQASLLSSFPTYASAASDTSFTIALPTGWAVGNVCYIGIECRGTGASVTTPAGWTAVAPVFNPVGVTNTCQVVLRRVLQAGDTGPTITVVSGRVAAISAAVQNADGTTPEDSVTPSEAPQSAATNSPVANSVTPNGSNDLLLAFFGAGDPTTSNLAMTFTQPTGMTLNQQVSTAQSGNTDAGLMLASLALSSNAATGTKTATITPSSGSVACNSQAVTLVVKSSGTGSTTGAAAFTGSGIFGAAPQLAEAAGLTGVGTLGTAPQVAEATGFSGSGTLGTSGAFAEAAAFAGQGTLGTSAQLAEAAAFAGSGTFGALGTLTEAAGLSGVGTFSASYGGAVAGAAAFTGVGTFGATSRLTAAVAFVGLGTFGAVPQIAETTAFAGVGTFGAVSRLTEVAALSGVGTFGATSISGTVVSLTGIGTFGATPLGLSAAFSGQGTFGTAVALIGSVGLTGVGTFGAPVALAGQQGLTGLGTFSAVSAVQVITGWSGVGTLVITALGLRTGFTGLGTFNATSGAAGAGAFSGVGVFGSVPQRLSVAAFSGMGTFGVAAIGLSITFTGVGTFGAVVGLQATFVGIGSFSSTYVSGRATGPIFTFAVGFATWSVDLTKHKWSMEVGQQKWVITVTYRMSSESVQLVPISVTGVLAGVVQDPTLYLVYGAALAPGVNPTSGDWIGAAWVAGQSGPSYIAQVLLGPLTKGEYVLWGRLVAGIEDVREEAGTIDVY